MIITGEPDIDPEKFIRAALLLGALTSLYARAERETHTVAPPLYTGNPGQRPGESYTQWRIRVRKEQS